MRMRNETSPAWKLWPVPTWPSSFCAGASCPRSRSSKSRSEEHTSELQSPVQLVCRRLLEKKVPDETPFPILQSADRRVGPDREGLLVPLADLRDRHERDAGAGHALHHVAGRAGRELNAVR